MEYDDWAKQFERSAERIHELHQQMRNEFLRLCAEPSARVPEVGDRVIVAIGLIGHGHAWIRGECLVLGAADTSFKVRLIGKKIPGEDEEWEHWVHAALITDVIGRDTP